MKEQNKKKNQRRINDGEVTMVKSDVQKKDGEEVMRRRVAKNSGQKSMAKERARLKVRHETTWILTTFLFV